MIKNLGKCGKMFFWGVRGGKRLTPKHYCLSCKSVFNTWSDVVTDLELAWNPLCTTMSCVKPRLKSVLLISSLEASMLALPPVPAVPIVALPEFGDSA